MIVKAGGYFMSHEQAFSWLKQQRNTITGVPMISQFKRRPRFATEKNDQALNIQYSMLVEHRVSRCPSLSTPGVSPSPSPSSPFECQCLTILHSRSDLQCSH